MGEINSKSVFKIFPTKSSRSVCFILNSTSQFGGGTFHVFSNHKRLEATLLRSIVLESIGSKVTGRLQFQLFPSQV